MVTKRYCVFYVLLFWTLCISGCSKTTIHLDDNYIYLCSYNYDTGISVLDSNGESLLQLSNADIFLCSTPDGTILPDVGQIPSDSILLIQSYEDNQVKGGVWNADKKEWEIQPENGSVSFSTSLYDGKLIRFNIGDNSYGLDFKPYSEKQQTYQVGDGILLQNADDRIITETGETYLNIDQFMAINDFHGTASPDSYVQISQVINSNYMILRCYVSEAVSDQGAALGTEYSYLCDSEGHILYPEWNYDYVVYAKDQFQQEDTRYLYFHSVSGETSQDHYLDLVEDQEVVLPREYETIFYQYHGLFLLGNENQFTIYDSITQSLGSTYSVSSPYVNSEVFGLDSYVIPLGSEGTVVIEGIRQPLDEEASVIYTLPGEYPVITAGKTSYILDTQGKLILSSEETIIHADEQYYLALADNHFNIHSYEK